VQKRVEEFILSHPGTAIGYVRCVHPETLEDVATINADTVMALAVTIDGRVRLLDNGVLSLP